MKKIEIALRKFLLQLLLALSKKPKQLPLNELLPGSKILFIRLNRIGDALVTTPLLKLIRINTNHKISVLAAKSNHFIFSNPDICDEVIVFDKKKNGLFKQPVFLFIKNDNLITNIGVTKNEMIGFSGKHTNFMIRIYPY